MLFIGIVDKNHEIFSVRGGSIGLNYIMIYLKIDSCFHDAIDEDTPDDIVYSR